MKYYICIALILVGLTITHFSQNHIKDNDSEQVNGASSSQKSDTKKISYRESLIIMLETHPIVGVRTEFLDAIKNNEIAISPTDTHAAAFVLVPKKYIVSSDFPVQELQPTIMIKPSLLTGDEGYTQLVLFHEYIHYRQWKEKRIPEDTFVLRSFDSVEQPAEICKQKWHAEIEAYHEECWLASQAGTLNLLPWCARVGTPDFIEDVKKASIVGDPSMRICAAFL